MECSTILDKLTPALTQKAFEKAKKCVTIDEGELVLIREADYDKALAFLMSSFLKDEAVAKSVGMVWNPMLESMCMEALQMNMSFMLVEPKSGEVIATRLIRVVRADEKMDASSVEPECLRKLSQYWEYAEGVVNFFDTYKAKETMHFFGLGVDERYRRRGIGTKLMDVSLKTIENLGISPICVKGEATSNFSKRIYEKFALNCVADVPFEDYKVNGEPVITNTGEHKSMKFYGKIIESKKENEEEAHTDNNVDK